MQIRFIPGRRALAVSFAALAAAAAALAAPPPGDAKPLSEILDVVQQRHPGMIVAAEFEHDRWEVFNCPSASRKCRELYVDPHSAQTLRDKSESHSSRRPPAGGKSAAQIARSVEERRLGTITEIEFDDGVWEVSVRGTGVRAKLYLDPVSGEMQRCKGAGCPAR